MPVARTEALNILVLSLRGWFFFVVVLVDVFFLFLFISLFCGTANHSSVADFSYCCFLLIYLPLTFLNVFLFSAVENTVAQSESQFS